MSAPTPLTPSIGTRQKPQVKSISPASRCLFGRNNHAAVGDMLSDMIKSERQRASNELNFDIFAQKPIKYEQQENIAKIDRTPEAKRRYVWKAKRSVDVPAFYSRPTGKKSLMPVDLSNICPEPACIGGRSVRRSLSAFLRTPSKELEPKSIARSSPACQLRSSPLCALLQPRTTDSPVLFDDSAESRVSSALPRPMAVHASAINGPTNSKVFAYAKSMSCRSVARSPLSHRANQSSLALTDTPVKSPFVPAATQIPGINTNSAATSSITERISNPSIAAPSNTPKAPSMRQTKITDTSAMKKSRPVAQKARKRLNLCEDSTSSVAATKMPRLSSGGN